MKEYAPKAVMTSFMWNWAPIFEDIVIKFAQNGENHLVKSISGERTKDVLEISEINMDIVPQEIADKVYETRIKLSPARSMFLAVN